MGRRFELTDERSNKFWEIERNGRDTTVTFGRIGTSGQSQTKQFASEMEAVNVVLRLISEKRRKGYTEVKAGAAPQSKPASVAAKPKAIPKSAGAVGARIAALDFDE